MTDRPPAPDWPGVCRESRWTWGKCSFDRDGLCRACRQAPRPDVPAPLPRAPLPAQQLTWGGLVFLLLWLAGAAWVTLR